MQFAFVILDIHFKNILISMLLLLLLLLSNIMLLNFVVFLDEI